MAVTVCYHLRAAYERVAQMPKPDLIIIDLMLGRERGEDLARYLRDALSLAAIPRFTYSSLPDALDDPTLFAQAIRKSHDHQQLLDAIMLLLPS